MKQVVNFRLNSQAIATLQHLQKKLHVSKTSILGKALEFYAKEQLRAQNSILEYAGILSEEDAISMLEVIESGQQNKNR
jgi:hypothetical protein